MPVCIEKVEIWSGVTDPSQTYRETDKEEQCYSSFSEVGVDRKAIKLNKMNKSPNCIYQNQS